MEFWMNMRFSTINFLCHGKNGEVAAEILSKTEIEPQGENCSTGGVIIYIGLDLNSDAELSEEEIQTSFILCHGNNGDSGAHGATNLSLITAEDAGIICENGGLKIETGLDEDADNVLDLDEIESTNYVCHGMDGLNGYSALTMSKTENPGANCPNGGIQILSGQDINNNGVLDDDEVVSTAYICNEAPVESAYAEYYFSNGIENYTGTSDVSIAKLDNEGYNEEELIVGSEINPANGFMYPTNSLIHF